jgi:prevent-host-death family protein
MKKVKLSDVTEDFPKYLHLAEDEEVVITRDGKPAGVLIGFRSEDDWLEFQLEQDPRFLQHIETSRQGLREGRGVRLEELDEK